jgi:hypothetical protein
MAVTAPDWLTKHGGELRPGAGDRAWMVLLSGEPLYVVAAVPAEGRETCKVTQANNGKRLDSGATYPTIEDAVRGGLEDLRKALGW